MGSKSCKFQIKAKHITYHMFYFIHNGCFCNIFLLWALVSVALEPLGQCGVSSIPNMSPGSLFRFFKD